MSDHKRRVLVTGGAGFIGSHVVDAYVALGDRVWVVDNLSSGIRDNVNHKVEFIEMDIADSALRDLFREVRFELVNQHAAQVDVRYSVDYPTRDASVNVLGLINVLEGVREVLGMPSFGEDLTTKETKSIQAYILGEARKAAAVASDID